MRTYEVKRGDSLWKIAKRESTTVDVLAHLNGLRGRQIHALNVGHQLILPEAGGGAPDSLLTLLFRGLDFSIFTPMKIKVEHDGKSFTHRLRNGHALPLTIHDHSLGLKVWVEGLEKKMIKTWECPVLPTGRWKLSIHSRKVKVAGNLMPRKGEAKHSTGTAAKETADKTQRANGDTSQQQTRIEDGKPVHVVATIYTESNLRLLPANEKYRAMITAAAQKYNLTPQSIAALIDAEAAHRREDGGWREDSNEGSPSKAQGLAQFFRPAWKDVFNMPTSLLCQDCKAISEEQWMKKRLEAKYAIDGAGAYAFLNLNNFAHATGFDVEGLAPEDKAKLAYLVHHEGLAGVRKLLQGYPKPYTGEEAFSRLKAQLSSSIDASRYAKQYPNNIDAYKGWLFNYIDKKINVQNFVVQDSENFANQSRSMGDIVASLSGQAAPATPKPRAEDAPPNNSPPPATNNTEPKPSIVGDATWFDPLDVCTIRTAHLASKRSAEFGMTRDNGQRAHQGLDLAAEPGRPVRAVANGTVHAAPMVNSGVDYGNTLVLEVGINDLPPKQGELFRLDNPSQQTIGFFYAHLSEYEHDVERDSEGKVIPIKVNAGDVIAKTGCTGNAKGMTSIPLGAHLHFEVRKKALLHCTGLANRVDPLPYIVNCTNP